MALGRSARRRLSHGMGMVLCGAVYAILFLPIAVVVVNSFNASTTKPYLAWEGFSLRWYGELLHNQALLAAFGNTMLLAVTTMLLSTAIGTLAAVGLYRYQFRGKGVISGLLYVPVIMPEIVMGISLLMLYVRVQIPRGMVGLLVAHVTFCLSFVVFNVRARLDGYDPALEEASMDLGAGRLRTFLGVTLPALAPGIASGALLSFTLSLDDVVVSYFVHGQDTTFPLQALLSIKGGVTPDINALSTIILLGTVALVAITQGGLVRRLRERRARRRDLAREAGA